MKSRKTMINNLIANFHYIGNKMHAHLAKLDNERCVTGSQLFVLDIIENNHNIGIKDIAKKLNISSSATTQLVDVLVAHSYVSRKINKNDRRAIYLQLSTKGQKYIDNFRSQRLAMISKLFDFLTDKELETYLKLQQKIFSKANK